MVYREVHDAVCSILPNPSPTHAGYFCKLAQDVGFLLHALRLRPLGRCVGGAR